MFEPLVLVVISFPVKGIGPSNILPGEISNEIRPTLSLEQTNLKKWLSAGVY